MKKLVYFVMVGLAFTAFQVTTVEAQTGAPHDPNLTENRPENRQDRRQDLQENRQDRRQDLRENRQDRRQDMKHMPPPMGDHTGMPPMGDHSGMTGEHPPGEHSSDMDAFRDCRKIRPKGDLELMREAKNCFRDLAREFGAKESARAEWKACKQIRPKGDLDLLEEKKNCFTDLASSLR